MATTMSMPSQMNGNTVVYPTLGAYNNALYQYTRKQFEDAERASRRRDGRSNSASAPKSEHSRSSSRA